MKKTYWEKRQEKLWKKQDKEEAKLNYKLSKEYKRMEKEIEQEISYFYQTYGEDNIIDFRAMVDQLTASERDLVFKNYDLFAQKYPEYAYLQPVRNSIYELNRIEGLQMDIWHKQMEIGAIEQEELNKLLDKSYTMAYQSTMRGLPNTGSFFSLNSKAMKDTISTRWIDGKNYSERIWGNKDKLARSLSIDLRNGIIRGDSYQNIAKQIQKKTNTGINETMRLVTTESAYIMNQANKQAFIDEGIEEYEITAILDRRTSKLCTSMNGQRFKFEDAKVGINYPPFHPWCRTTVIPIENEVEDSERKTNNLLETARKNEPLITEDLISISSEVGTSLKGIEYRIKSFESLNRKIKNNSNSNIRDVVRYTSVSNTSEIVDDFDAFVANLKNRGYNISRVKNYWSDSASPYKGINANLISPDNYEFELQFHTEESFELKNGKLHELYEKARVLDPLSSEVVELNREMMKLSKQLIRPKAISKIKDVK